MCRARQRKPTTDRSATSTWHPPMVLPRRGYSSTTRDRTHLHAGRRTAGPLPSAPGWTVDARTDREKVLDVVQKTFDALAERNGSKLRALFWPEASLATDRPDAQGVRRQTFSSVEGF